MATIDVGKDIHSLSDFKRNTSEFLLQMRETGHPVVLTINGKAELVVLGASTYQKLIDQIDELEALNGLKRGLADAEGGRVTPVAVFEKEFRKKHGLSRRPRIAARCGSRNYSNACIPSTTFPFVVRLPARP